MPGLYSKYIKLVYTIGDMAAIILASIIAYVLTADSIKIQSTELIIKFIGFSLVAWFTCSTLLGAHFIYRVTNTAKVIVGLLKVTLLYVLLVEATIKLFAITVVPQFFLYHQYLILLATSVLTRLSITYLLKLYRMRGYNYRNVIIVGYGGLGNDLKDFFLSRPEYGYRFYGFFDNKELDNSNIKGKVEDVEAFVKEHSIDEIYCNPLELNKEQLYRLIDFVDNNLVRLKILPQPGEFLYKKLKVDFYDMLPILMLRSIPLDDAVNKIFKRSFDLFFSSIVIVFVLSWLVPLLALLIRIDSKGPIFFKQERSGINNKSFNCFKLRTMYVNSGANLFQAKRGDSRITPIGAFLRKTSLDELPQFFNVFLGHMSVVGPRPHMIKHTKEYAAMVDKFMVRHFVKPGITGLSQVRGYRGDTSELYQMRGRVKLDIFYLENWSFVLDLKIILTTITNIIKGDDKAF